MKNYWLLLSLLATACHHSSIQEQCPLVSIQIQDRNGLTETISTPDRLEVFEQLDFLESQPFKKVLRVYKQQGKNSAKITTYHPNGTPWQYLETQEMRAFGAYKEWHPNGQLKIEATVIGGAADITPGAQREWLFDNLAKVFDDQGRLIAEIFYEKGELADLSHYYYPNGALEKSLPYSKNQLHGEAFEYWPTKQIKSSTHYNMGKKEGVSSGFWTSGEVCWKEHYRDGQLLEGQYFTKVGELISEVRNGYGFQSIFDQEILAQKVEIRKGKPEGLVQIFTVSGELLRIYHVKLGKKHGEEIEYFLSYEKEDGLSEPLTKLSIPWIDDTISGIVKTWYSNGKLESQRELSRNKKTGTSLAWYREGGLMYMEEYEEDKLLKGTYYKKNQKDSVSTVINGNGVATIFDENGIFLRKIPYSKGKPIDPDNT